VSEEPILLTPAEVAKLWSCSAKTVSRKIRDGSLPSIRISPRVVRVRADVAEAIARGERPANVGTVHQLRRSQP
jgi:excisionase family DNA binding protein